MLRTSPIFHSDWFVSPLTHVSDQSRTARCRSFPRSEVLEASEAMIRKVNELSAHMYVCLVLAPQGERWS